MMEFLFIMILNTHVPGHGQISQNFPVNYVQFILMIRLGLDSLDRLVQSQRRAQIKVI